MKIFRNLLIVLVFGLFVFIPFVSYAMCFMNKVPQAVETACFAQHGDQSACLATARCCFSWINKSDPKLGGFCEVCDPCASLTNAQCVGNSDCHVSGAADNAGSQSGTSNNSGSQSGTSNNANAVVERNLPNALGTGTQTFQLLIGNIINSVLGIVGSIALLMFIYGGFTWLTSGGIAANIKKGRDIIIWATIGMAVIFLSYGLVKFLILNIK